APARTADPLLPHDRLLRGVRGPAAGDPAAGLARLVGLSWRRVGAYLVVPHLHQRLPGPPLPAGAAGPAVRRGRPGRRHRGRGAAAVRAPVAGARPGLLPGAARRPGPAAARGTPGDDRAGFPGGDPGIAATAAGGAGA